MSDIVIKAENLGKKYIIGHQAENGRYLALRDVLMQNARNLWYKTKDMARGKPIIIGNEMEEVWALKDVSFEVQRGEVVGIIGRNGAGKSTLLKILSRITEPTEGYAEIHGRVGSLLEVGTGFHPELTGRENIYLNGAILGMRKREIDKKFDEIVAFAEVEKYIDTPVKRYSSGMYVRLAFAVAAQLEPEILLVDEVLAVGDAAFQKKCLGKMGDVAKEGRTVLFVSHNMGAISRLCPRSMWLENGKIRCILPSAQAVNEYLADSTREGYPEVSFSEEPDKGAQFLAIRVLNSQNLVADKIDLAKPFSVQLDYVVRVRDPGIYFAFYLQNVDGIQVLFSDSRDDPSSILLGPGIYRSTIKIPPGLLAPGRYFVTTGIATTNGYQMLDHRQQVCSFSLHDFASVRGDSRPGVLGIKLRWDTSRIP